MVGSCDNSSDVSEVNGSLRACLSTLSLDTIAVPKSGFRFYLVLDFWLAWATTGLRVLFVPTCELDTGTGWESIPLRSSLSRVSLSLNTVVVEEVDKLEEDVG